ncbi:LuxR C-terminal-related transcriptional regulator [Streptomyces sp. H10-C2]|uniref:helix-turn-helix transcriptional regulator n=1 Tax=unclassified Streptomyces TaxID=2593676 RepID=UPI0024BA8B65|nr:MULTISPECIES: LuxR family transcriptional regulator [unclassified Streptomyces]MDJ0341878.1 LuxR C-terminal-related transcriptional regulator [Streptomyces sp. PH10-H1]MDJ0370368.1 LuxR C-terminal-related transcriptional regulator [Streptomyces sp. H10-C2]
MTERPFEALGLSADADRAYHLLVATRGVAAAGLARDLGLPPARAEAVCAELGARGLVRSGADGRWYPVPPRAGLLPLLSRTQEQLRQGRELLDRLAVEYQRVHEGYRAEEIVQVVEGYGAAGLWADQLRRSARTEVASFVRGPFPADGEGRDPLEAGPERLGEGVRHRVVRDRSALETPGALDGACGERAACEEVRVAKSLPMRLCIADRELALLPLGPESEVPGPALMLVRPSGLLDALVALFDAVWASSTPLRERGSGGRSAVQLRILAMLVNGGTDQAMARALGVAVRTVQRHLAVMERAAGVENRVQLVWHAARHGWLDEADGVGNGITGGMPVVPVGYTD